MNKFEIKAKIEREFKELTESFVVNITVEQHIYNLAPIILMDYIIKKLQLKQGLYVSLNKPYETIQMELKKNKVDANSIYCIDGVSKETGKFSQTEKCFCLEDPSSLTELLVIINTLLNDNKIKFIILDSLSTLLLYNDVKEVEKFAHSLLNKARKSKVSVVIMSPEEESKEDILAEITQFCDKEINL